MCANTLIVNAGAQRQRGQWLGMSTEHDDRRASLRSHRRVGGRLTLVYRAAAATQVRELVRREEDSCAFLRFTVVTGAAAVTLDVQVPHTAVDAAADPLAPFLVGSMTWQLACLPDDGTRECGSDIMTPTWRRLVIPDRLESDVDRGGEGADQHS